MTNPADQILIKKVPPTGVFLLTSIFNPLNPPVALYFQSLQAG